MTKIYEQFDKAFAKVSAYAIFKGAAPVGRVCFKHPKDGAGRLWCYVQVWGAEMVRGYAGGYGYDKASAAFIAAAGQLYAGKQDAFHFYSFRQVQNNGHRWSDQLKDLGYTVQHVIDG